MREKSRLNKIHDIVGARIVVPDIATQEDVLRATLEEFADSEPRVVIRLARGR